jgi:hypothetical protein
LKAEKEAADKKVSALEAEVKSQSEKIAALEKLPGDKHTNVNTDGKSENRESTQKVELIDADYAYQNLGLV